jgi:hypothetical protein
VFDNVGFIKQGQLLPLGGMAFSIMTLITIGPNVTLHKLQTTLSIEFCYSEYHNAKFHYAECDYAECHFAEFHCSECHFAMCIMLNVILLSVIMLSVIISSVSFC